MMKIRNIPLTMSAPWCAHSFKRNPVALAAAAAASAASSLGGSIFGYKTGKATNRTNLQIARETNDMNYKIAQEANQMQQQNLWDNMAWQEKMYNAQNEYNSIGSQLARASAAGVNPYSLLDNGAGTAEAGNVPSSPSSGFTPAVAQMQAAHVDNPAASFGSIFNSVASGISQLVQAGVNTEKLTPELELLAQQTKKAISETTNQDLQNEMQQMFNFLQSKHGERRYLAETRKFVEDANAAAASANASDASALLSKAQAELTAAKTDTEKQLRTYQVNIAKQTVELVKAQTSSARADSVYKQTQAADLVATRQARIDQMNADKDLKQSLAKLNNLDFDVRSPNKQKEIESVTKELEEQIKRSDVYTQEMRNQMEYWKAQAEKAKKEADWRTYTMCLEMFRDVAIGGAALASGAKNVKSMRTPPTPKKSYVSPNTSTTPHGGDTYYPKSSSSWENVNW